MSEDLEQQTLDFLRKKDKHFVRKNKSALMEYPYHSERQTKIRQSKEIPASSLSNKQKMSAPLLGEPLEFD